MKRKLFVPILCLIGLMSFVVLGSSPTLVAQIIETAQDNPITQIFSPKIRSDYQKSTVESSKVAENSKIVREMAPKENTEAPEFILYGQVFHLVSAFNDLAKTQEDKGEVVTQFRTYFKDASKLSEQDDDFLTQTANHYNQEVRVIDEQAEVVIQELRRQFSSRPAGELIKPSPELLELQEKRNNLALIYRDKLKDLLGIDKFNEFDRFVKGDFAAGFKVMPVPTNQPVFDQGGE